MKIIAFAFKENVSSEVLSKLRLKNKHFIISSNNAIKNFLNKLIKEKPNYILGLGMYSRKDKDKLRIETHYSINKKKQLINSFLLPSKNAKLSNGIGNSYCNNVSMQIMEAIKNRQLKSEYTFIHIPKTFQVNKAVSEIEVMLSNLNKKKLLT